MRKPVALAAAVVICLVLVLGAQSPQAPVPAPTFRGGVDLVEFDVSVLGHDRRPVKGLTASDFTVTEDGKPQSVAAFAAVDIPNPPPVTASWMRNVTPDVVTNDQQVRRIVVILLDDVGIQPEDVPPAKAVADAVVNRLQPHDLAAVSFTFEGRRADLTGDRRQLLAAIDTLRAHPDDSAPPARYEAAFASGTQIAQTSKSNGQGPCSHRGTYAGSTSPCIADAMVHIGTALDAAPLGRKTLVYVSRGVPYEFTMGNLQAATDVQGLRALFKALQQANVNVYAIDPSGLSPSGVLGPKMDALRMFAETTGGRATVGTNAPEEAVAQVFRENSSYYLLGFRSTNPKEDGRFRRVQVTVDRPDVDVRARTGYYAPKGPTPGAATTLAASPVDQALASPVPGGQLPLAMDVAPFALPGGGSGKSAIAVTVQIQSGADASDRQTANVVATALDREWRPRSTFHQTVQVTRRADASPGGSYEVFSRLNVPPGHYEVRVAGSSAGVTGNVIANVDVPDFGKAPLSMSGLELALTPPLPHSPASALEALMPLIPTTVRTFATADRAVAFVQLYEGGNQPLTGVHVAAQVVDELNVTRSAETRVIVRSDFTVSRSANYEMTLPLSSLTPGDYLLRIDATAGAATAHRDVRFTVR